MVFTHMNNSRCRSLCNFWILSAVTLLCFCQVMPSHGQALSIYNVTGAGGAGTWDVAGNWIPNGIPNGAGSIVSITSNISPGSVLNLSVAHTIGMMFIGDQNNTNAFSITGSTLTFDNTLYGNAFLSKVQAANQVDVISANINLLSNLDINVNPGGSGAELDLSGAISGAFGINTMGGGRVRLSGATSNTYTGLTTVYMRGYGDSGNPNLVLAKTGGAIAVSGNLKLGNVSQGGSGSAVMQYSTNVGTTGEQIWDGATITFDGSSGNNPYYKLMGYEETVRGIVDYTREGVIQVVEGETLTYQAGMGADIDSTLTLATQAGDQFYYGGYMRNKANSGVTNPSVLNVAVTGTGKQTLAGDRISYTGTTTIGAGATLVLENASNFNSSSISNSGTLGFHLTNGDRTFNKVISGTGALTRTGGNTLTFDSTGTGGVALEFSSVTIQGGTTNFNTAANVGAGGFVIDGTKATAIATWQNTGVFNVTGGVSITGAFVSGGGNVNPQLNVNTASSITGVIDISSGTIQVGSAGTLGAASVAAINISDGGLLNFSAVSTGTQDRVSNSRAVNLNGGRLGFTQSGAGAITETLGALSLTAGSNSLETVQGGGGTSTLTFASLARTAGATVQFTDSLIGNANDKIVFTAVPTLDAGGLIGGWATVGASGANAEFATYAGGSVIAAASVDSAENTWVAANNIKMASTARTLTGARTINSLNIQSGTARTLSLANFNLTVNSGGILSSGQAHVISAGTGRLTAGPSGGVSSGLYELNTIVQNNQLTISAVIQNNGANVVSLVKSGTGLLILSGSNLYTGLTSVNNGTLRISNETNLGAVPAIAGNNLVLNGGTLQITATTAIDDAGRNVLLRAGDGTIQVSTGQTATIANTVTSSEGGRLLLNAVSGSFDGTLTLTGANNNLSGGIESVGNTLTGGLIMNGTGVGTVGLIRLFGGAVDIRGTNSFTNDIILKGGLLTLAGTNTFTAGDHSITLDGGELILNSATAISGGYALSMTTATYDLNGASTSVSSFIGGGSAILENGGVTNSVFTVNQVSNTSFLGTIQDAGFTDVGTNVTSGATLSLLKTGNGVLTLSGLSSSYDGSTTINAGVLNVLQISGGGFGSSIGASSYAPGNLVLNGGTLRYSGNAASGQTAFTDRSFTLGAGASAGAIIADGVGLGSVMQFIPSQPFGGAFTGTLPVAFTGSGQRTLILGGANRGENYFGLVLGDGTGGATSLNKTGNGLWRVDPHVYAIDSTWSVGGNVITISNTTNLKVGQLVYPGYGFPEGTYITIVNPGSVTVSQNAIDDTYSGDINFPIPFMGSSYSGETVVKAGILSTDQNGSFGTGKVIVGGGAGGLSAPGLYHAALELRGVNFTGYGGALQTLILEGGTLSATNNFSLTDSSWAGEVVVAANSNLNVSAGSQLTLPGTISGTGSLTQLGEGTVVLSGANDATRNTSNTAGYTVQAGTLVLDYSTNTGSKMSDSASLSLGGGRLGGVVEIRGGAAVREIVSGLTLNSGDNIITRTSGTSSLRLNNITRNSGATINFSADDIASTTSPNVNGILGAWATVGGTDWATKSAVLDSGTNFFIRALGAYTNSVATNDWIVGGNMNAFFTATGDNIQNTRTANSLRFNSPSTTTSEMLIRLRNLNTLESGGILVTSNMGTDAAVIGQFDSTGALTTLASDLLILQNNPNAPLVISATLQGTMGLDKLGVGNLILTGTNTYTGVTVLNAGTTTIKTLADAGVASGIGAANVVNSYNYLVFNGGTLQYNGAAGINTSNRGYTVNSLAVWDVGNENTTLKLTGQYLTASAEGDYAVKKIGSGVLELSGTSVGGFGLNSWEISDGTARLIAGNTNDQFARNLDASLTMSGGTLELVGGGASNTDNRSQNFKGRLNIMEGASTIKVTSLAGTNGGNARAAVLNLQDSSDPQPIRFGRASSLMLVEDMTSGNIASITIAGQLGVDLQVIIPRAVYSRVGASVYPGVNYFAVIDGNGNNVIPSDNDEFGTGTASHFTASDVTDVLQWNPVSGIYVNVTDGALAGAGYFGTTTVDSTINTLRFFNNQDPDSIVTIGAANLLTIEQGAILQTTHSGNTLKAINGGELTSNLTNDDDDTVDLLVHNWNPLRALQISSAIVDNPISGRVLNFVQTGNGTTALSGANTYTGSTYVQGGVLRLDSAGALPNASHLRFDGGVLGLNFGDFTRSLGTGTTQVDWTSSGGFAAYTADRTVNLGGAGATVVWGAGSFVPDNDTFILGAYDADKMVIFANGLDLGRKDRMIKVADGAADFDGQLTGVVSGETGGILTKTGHGGLQLTNANTYKSGTVLAQGLLHGTVNSSFGTGAISIGSTSDSEVADALELRYGGSTLTNAITVGNASLGNTQGISTIRTTNAAVAVSGLVNFQKHTFLAPASGTTVTVSSVVSGTKGLTLIDGGTLSLTNNANSYGTASGAAGTAVNGGTVIRNGTVLIGASGALGTSAIELGDATYAKASAAYATTRTVLGVERTINDNADGLSALGGEFVSNGDGTRDGSNFPNSGQGAFYNISKTIDGYTFQASDAVAGTRILVKDESENPERNGIYEVVQINADGTMNITRVADFDDTTDMLYGSQVAITSGSSVGKVYFMAAPDITTVNGIGTDPALWLQDVQVNPNVSLYANAASLTVTNAIDVNANGSGTTAIGTNSNLTGVSFTGNVTLQNVKGSLVAESKTLTLESATTTGAGVTFSGIISEADGVGATPDVLSVIKAGAGLVTMTGINTYHGTTTINAGNLQVGNGGIGQSGTGVTTLNGPTAVLSGTGTVQGATTIVNGVIRPGDAGGTGTGVLTFSNGLAFSAPDTIVSTVIELQISGSLDNDTNRDRINVTSGTGTLVLNNEDKIQVLANGFTPTINTSYSWNLLDWVGVLTANGFSSGTTGRTGFNGDNNEGNLDLFDISSITGSTWDTSQFLLTGVVSIVAVPEPGRFSLLALALAFAILRRRRKL